MFLGGVDARNTPEVSLRPPSSNVSYFNLNCSSTCFEGKFCNTVYYYSCLEYRKPGAVLASSCSDPSSGHASALPPGEEQRLRSLLMSSPNPSHEVFIRNVYTEFCEREIICCSWRVPVILWTLLMPESVS